MIFIDVKKASDRVSRELKKNKVNSLSIDAIKDIYERTTAGGRTYGGKEYVSNHNKPTPQVGIDLISLRITYEEYLG